MDRFFLGPLAQIAHQIERQVQRQLYAPGPAGDLHQPAVARQLAADGVGFCNHPLDRLHRRGIVGIDFDVERQHLLVAAAQHGQRAMAGHVGPALDMVEIVGKFRAGLLLAIDDARAQEGAFLHIGPQSADQIGILGELFGQDVARSLEGRLGINDVFADVGQRQLGGHGRTVGENSFRQRAQPTLARDLGLGPALRLVRQVDVFELGLGDGRSDLCLELFGQLALLTDRTKDGVAARVKLAQIGQPLGKVAQLRVVEAAGDLLAVARHERHGRTVVEQADRRRGLFGPRADLGGYDGCDALDVGCHVVPVAGRNEQRP